jgi:hypothetical protein
MAATPPPSQCGATLARGPRLASFEFGSYAPRAPANAPLASTRPAAADRSIVYPRLCDARIVPHKSVPDLLASRADHASSTVDDANRARGRE